MRSTPLQLWRTAQPRSSSSQNDAAHCRSASCRQKIRFTIRKFASSTPRHITALLQTVSYPICSKKDCAVRETSAQTTVFPKGAAATSSSKRIRPAAPGPGGLYARRVCLCRRVQFSEIVAMLNKTARQLTTLPWRSKRRCVEAILPHGLRLQPESLLTLSNLPRISTRDGIACAHSSRCLSG